MRIDKKAQDIYGLEHELGNNSGLKDWLPAIKQEILETRRVNLYITARTPEIVEVVKNAVKSWVDELADEKGGPAPSSNFTTSSANSNLYRPITRSALQKIYRYILSFFYEQSEIPDSQRPIEIKTVSYLAPGLFDGPMDIRKAAYQAIEMQKGEWQKANSDETRSILRIAVNEGFLTGARPLFDDRIANFAIKNARVEYRTMGSNRVSNWSKFYEIDLEKAFSQPTYKRECPEPFDQIFILPSSDEERSQLLDKEMDSKSIQEAVAAALRKETKNIFL